MFEFPRRRARTRQNLRKFPPIRPVNHKGYVLTLTIALGLAMMILGLTAAMFIQTDNAIANNRKQNGQTLALTESGIERLMLQLSQRHNSLLLARNYDPINPRTNKNYLGPDGAPNSNDETNVTLDEWAGYSPASYPCFQQAGVVNPQFPALLTGSLPGGGSYRLLAYRYDPYSQTGSLLVEGTQAGQVSTVVARIHVAPELTTFPGVAAQRDRATGPTWAAKIVTRGRAISGSHANVYFPFNSSGNPAVPTTVARINAPDNPSPRGSFSQAIWADPTLDGAGTDNISGQIIACNPDFRDYVYEDEFGPDPSFLSNSGVIDTSRTITAIAGNPNAYLYNRIELDTNETLTVDTTNGPVFLYFTNPNGSRSDAIILRDNAKIINMRTDGKPPRVGDLRLLATGDNSGGGVRFKLYGQSCIENAHAFIPYGDLMVMTTGGGCPTSPNANAVGVFWVESILSSKNAAGNRNQPYQGTSEHDSLVTAGAISGIRVPEDVSSLYDVLRFVRIPWRYRFGEVRSWQQVRI